MNISPKDFFNLNKNADRDNRSKKADDIYSMSILQPLLADLPYLPFNGGALRPVCIAYILNEIIINSRKKILEFGSGLSTILMARLIKKNQLDTRIFSVEHNKEWASILTEYLKKEDLLQFVTIITADLEQIQTPLGSGNWYEQNTLSKNLRNKKFDLIIVDGPPANSKKIRYSRHPALMDMKEHFEEDFCLMLDDVNRKGERHIMASFLEKNKDINFTLISETLAVFRTTNNFNPIPIHY